MVDIQDEYEEDISNENESMPMVDEDISNENESMPMVEDDISTENESVPVTQEDISNENESMPMHPRSEEDLQERGKIELKRWHKRVSFMDTEKHEKPKVFKGRLRPQPDIMEKVRIVTYPTSGNGVKLRL